MVAMYQNAEVTNRLLTLFSHCDFDGGLQLAGHWLMVWRPST
jgi:hypothetical protein